MSYTSTDVTPVTEPITVAMAEEQLYLPDQPNATLLQSYITAARQWVENYTGRHMVPKNVVYMDAMTSRTVVLPYLLDTITSITIDGKTVSGTKCSDNAVQLSIYAPSGNLAIKYKSLAETNQVLITAALLIVGHLYENRQLVDGKMGNVKMLLDPFRIINPMS
jgi:hypothetical protein